ncbi:hypothetical protein ACFWBX_34450 [Streptomyces sp. NPDC059991]
MSRPYRIVYAPEAVEDLAALGKGEALREAIDGGGRAFSCLRR